ncbi:MAG: HNH endonuclease [Rhodobacteraceae bacterium]|nr:HNH endonuclease [Paracoccaceae bacterium]
MKIDLEKITVRDLVEGYSDDGEGGVRGYGGKLDIRPPFQREFVYKDKQRDAVVETINKGFPLNVMYWALRQDGTYEVIDGQQRTISAAQYVKSDYSLDGRYFHNLQDDEQERILDYELQVYVCEGSASEKLAWFRIVNIAGERLTGQELRNAVYAGSWVSDAKRHFSRKGAACPAYAIGSRYVNGKAERQEYLETAIEWIKDEGEAIEEYMAARQHDKTATALWSHFQAVINRVEAVFPYYRRQMKGVDWGGLYGKLKDESLDPEELEDDVARLMIDDDVTKKAGIYPYLLTGEERWLNIRAFSESMKQKAFEIQNGICGSCGKKFEISEMEADHIIPWCEGGKTIEENCQMLCKHCNRRKSNK